VKEDRLAKRYDVFLSFKNLGPDGKPSRDSILAEDIYRYLFARRLSVFLSTFELAAQGVSAYKKAIDAALDASRVLVAVGASVENLESERVRYEWDGFFNDIISGVKPDGRVFSYTDSIDFKTLPRALRQSQSIVHRDGSLEILYRFVANALGVEDANDTYRDMQLMPHTEYLPSERHTTGPFTVRWYKDVLLFHGDWEVISNRDPILIRFVVRSIRDGRAVVIMNLQYDGHTRRFWLNYEMATGMLMSLQSYDFLPDDTSLRSEIDRYLLTLPVADA
jgi:hypothetical protein